MFVLGGLLFYIIYIHYLVYDFSVFVVIYSIPHFTILPFPNILVKVSRQTRSVCSFTIPFPILPVPNILVQSDGINGGIRPLILTNSSVRNRPLCLPISL